MALTRAQILAIIDRGETVTVWDTRYDSRNRNSVPTDLQLLQIYSAQASASDPSPDSRFYISTSIPSVSDGRINDAWLWIGTDPPFLFLKTTASAWTTMYVFPPANPTFPDRALTDMTDVELTGGLNNGNGFGYSSDIGRWTNFAGYAAALRGPWVANSELEKLYKAGDIVMVTVDVTTTFYMYVSTDASQESDPTTDDGFIWKSLGSASGGGAVGKMSWQDTWDEHSDYLIGDVVSSGDNIYVSLTDHAAAAVTPPHDITDLGGNWALLATSLSGMLGTNNLSELSDIAIARENLGAMANPMTSTGDLIYQPPSNTNVALSSLGAVASASGSDPTSLPAKLIDGVDTNAASWAGVAPSPIGTWIKVDLGTPQLIGSMRLHQEPAGSWGQYRIQHYTIESSLDNSSWDVLEASHDAASVGDETFTLASGPVTARYFRLTSLDLASAQWGVWTWEIRTAPGAAARLPSGTAGQILTIVGVIPTWVTPLPRLISAGAFTLSSGVANITVPLMTGTNAVFATFSEAPTATDELYTAITSGTTIRVSSRDGASTKSGYWQVIKFA